MARRKWQQVYQDILEQIRSGRYPQGSRFPSVEELCRIYEPSNITIRRACEELKKDGWVTTRDRQGAYVTEPLKELKIFLCNKSFSADFLKDSMPLRHFHETVEAYAAGIPVNIIPVTLDQVMEDADAITAPMVVFFNTFVDADGMRFRINRERIDFFRERFNPLVFGGYEETQGMHQIRVNRYHAFRRAVRYLADKGHRRIGYVSQMLTIPGVLERFKGYLDGMAECGIMGYSELVKTVPRSDYNEVDGVMAEFLAQPEPPSAIIFSNDRKALNALAFCRRHGVKVPEQLAVIGYDGTPDGALSEPPLTTFAGTPLEAGRHIMDYVKLCRIGMTGRILSYELESPFIERGSA
jgi:DNA-binding transcriptional regulator YhcF (GntR family)